MQSGLHTHQACVTPASTSQVGVVRALQYSMTGLCFCATCDMADQGVQTIRPLPVHSIRHQTPRLSQLSFNHHRVGLAKCMQWISKNDLGSDLWQNLNRDKTAQVCTSRIWNYETAWSGRELGLGARVQQGVQQDLPHSQAAGLPTCHTHLIVNISEDEEWARAWYGGAILLPEARQRDCGSLLAVVT